MSYYHEEEPEKKEHGSENNEANTTNVVVSKPNVKHIKWSPENELIMVEWCDIAQCYKWLHTRCHRKLAALHAWFTIPAIALSTISGTASFAQTSLPLDAQPYAPMVIGSINILIGISTTIQQYLKISELNELHRVSGILWDKFARNIRIELAKDPDERMDAGHFLKICRQEFDRLMETSPSIDQAIIEEFNRIFKGKETEEQKIDFMLKQQKRFADLRKPDICDIIISSNESRHTWYKDPERIRRMNNEFMMDPVVPSDIENPEPLSEKMPEPTKIIDVLKIQKDIQKEEEDRKKRERMAKLKQGAIDLANKIKTQTTIIEDYVKAFEENVGRKPISEEITLNMKDQIDADILQKFLRSYEGGSEKNPPAESTSLSTRPAMITRQGSITGSTMDLSAMENGETKL